jgi:protein involved in polysaccharide export with SLBB domain
LYIPIVAAWVASAQAQQFSDRVYTLGIGDRLRVIVYGEEDLSGEYEIGSQGTINLPLINEIAAANKTISEVEDSVEAKLAEGYLKSPSVSIEVLNYRPFYILGEVNAPGSYPYVNGMTVLTAVALAGGYTYRAREDPVKLSRTGDDREIEVSPTTPLLPGDIIKVEERFF